MTARVLLLLPTSTYRTRDFMDAAVRLGVEIVVASEEPSTMEALSAGSLLTLDFLDPEGAATDVAKLHESRPMQGIVAVDEETAVVAAAIGERLGLPHNRPESAARARLKHEMRAALAQAGLAGPDYRVLSVRDDPRALAGDLAYPAVLKPVFLSGSRGVVRVDDAETFVRWFLWLRELLAEEELARRGGEHAGLVLVEDYVPGDEVAVEALLEDGELHTLALFDKPDPLEGPTFEETIYVTPSRHPPALRDAIEETTSRAASALGLRHGPVHAELRLPPVGKANPAPFGGGEPVTIEIAGRSIGGLCSRTLRFGLGLSLEELILRHALGEDVATVARERDASGVMMVPIPRAGRLESVEGLEDARAVPGVREVTITATLGEELVPLPRGSSYLGFIFARAERPEEVEAALRESHRRLRFDVRHLDGE